MLLDKDGETDKTCNACGGKFGAPLHRGDGDHKADTNTADAGTSNATGGEAQSDTAAARAIMDLLAADAKSAKLADCIRGAIRMCIDTGDLPQDLGTRNGG